MSPKARPWLLASKPPRLLPTKAMTVTNWSRPSNRRALAPTFRPVAIGKTNGLSTGIATGLAIWLSASSIDSSSSVASPPDTTNSPVDSMPSCISPVPMSGYCEHALGSDDRLREGCAVKSAWIDEPRRTDGLAESGAVLAASAGIKPGSTGEDRIASG